MKYSLSAVESLGLGITLIGVQIESIEVYESKTLEGEISVQYQIVTKKQDIPLDMWDKWKSNRSLSCVRCGHEWISILHGRHPNNCPKCKSPYWQKPRRSQAITESLWWCKRCDKKWPVVDLSVRTCQTCGADLEIVNNIVGYTMPAGHGHKSLSKINPMIIEKDGKKYRVEYSCDSCLVSWPKDMNVLNVECPQCRRKCGASSRRVEVQESPTVSDEQMSTEEFQDVWKKLREETVAGNREETVAGNREETCTKKDY